MRSIRSYFIWLPQFQVLQLLKFGTLSFRLFECVPAMILPAINSRPTTSSWPSNPLSACSLAPQIRLWLTIERVYKFYLLTYLLKFQVSFSFESHDTFHLLALMLCSLISRCHDYECSVVTSSMLIHTCLSVPQLRVVFMDAKFVLFQIRTLFVKFKFYSNFVQAYGRVSLF